MKLEEMSGWKFHWPAIQAVLESHESSVYWLAITIALVFILGTQFLFFPLFYRGMKFQAPGSMRLAYLCSLMVGFLVFHWWLWHVIFVSLTMNYWFWLAWGLFFFVWFALIFTTPKRRVGS